MSLIIYAIYVLIAVADLVLSIVFMKLGHDSNDRNEKIMLISFSVVYMVMTIYFATLGIIHGIIA